MFTIGFTGSERLKMSEFFKNLVKVNTENGVQRDQDHPPSLYVATDIHGPEDLLNNYRILIAGGSHFIVSTDSLSDEDIVRLKRELQRDWEKLPHQDINFDDFEILAKKPDESEENFIRRILAKAYSDEQKRHEKNYGFIDLSLEIERKDETGRSVGKLRDYAREKKISGIIGGGGVMAGAHYGVDAAKTGVNVFFVNHSTAYNKDNFFRGVGESFIPGYQMCAKSLAALTGTRDREGKLMAPTAVACNTVCIAIDEMCQGEDILIHLGKATIRSAFENYPHARKIGFIGTPSTMTHEKSPYREEIIEEVRREREREKLVTVETFEGIRLNPRDSQYGELHQKWMDMIYRAIYKVKGYQTEEAIARQRRGEDITNIPLIQGLKYSELEKQARDLVDEVVREMRDEYGDIPIALVCTELPPLYKTEELARYNLISSTDALSVEAQRKLREIEGYGRSGRDIRHRSLDTPVSPGTPRSPSLSPRSTSSSPALFSEGDEEEYLSNSDEESKGINWENLKTKYGIREIYVDQEKHPLGKLRMEFSFVNTSEVADVERMTTIYKLIRKDLGVNCKLVRVEKSLYISIPNQEYKSITIITDSLRAQDIKIEEVDKSRIISQKHEEKVVSLGGSRGNVGGSRGT